VRQRKGERDMRVSERERKTERDANLQFQNIPVKKGAHEGGKGGRGELEGWERTGRI